MPERSNTSPSPATVPATLPVTASADFPVALTIAGSDPSGGAGLQADLKTFHQHHVYGMSAVTLCTVQNTRGVMAVEFLSPEFVRAQIEAVISDIPPRAAKTGALCRIDIIRTVAECAPTFHFPLIIDPVMVSKHGHPLLDDEAVRVVIEELLPHATLVTPNLFEAARLTGLRVESASDMERAARMIASMGPKHVLVKGGHLPCDPMDLLWSEGTTRAFRAERIETTSTHGSGCTLSAAITARSARGDTIEEALVGARLFVRRAMLAAPRLGGGVGPLHHGVATSD